MRFIFFWLLSLLAFFAEGQNNFLEWDRTCDTGRSVSYLTDFEKDVLRELNKVRTDPSQFAELYLVPMLNDFNGGVNTRTHVQTQEGVDPVKECIDQLKKTASIGLLNPNEKLHGTAYDHTSAQSKTKQVGHTSPNGDTFVDRVKKFRFPTAAECISYGEETARGVVISLLIDDGVANRGHRKTILNPQLDAAGVSAGGHQVFGRMCTIDFAGGGSRSK